MSDSFLLPVVQDMLQNILESYQDKAQDTIKSDKKKVRKDGGKQRRSSKSKHFPKANLTHKFKQNVSV